MLLEIHFKLQVGWGAWVAHSVKQQALDFSSGHDLRDEPCKERMSPLPTTPTHTMCACSCSRMLFLSLNLIPYTQCQEILLILPCNLPRI